MSEAGRYPPPNLMCPAEEPVLRPPTFLWTPQQAEKFQASRDWSWTPSVPQTSLTPDSPFAFSGREGPHRLQYVQHWSSGPYHHGYQARQGLPQSNWGKKQKKQKEPEFSHFCDACDKGFKHQVKYDEHVAQHVKCPVVDCSFTAHVKLVEIHKRNSHAPGAKRIKLDTPEEIAKWREERKRNYPTLSYVQKKVKIMEVKEKRGDVLETAQFGRFKRRGRGGGRGFQNQGRGAYSGRQHFHTGSAEEKRPPAITQPSQDGDPLGVLARSDPDSEKDEPVKETKVVVSVAPKNMTSALGSLMSSYGDFTESEEELEDTRILKTALALEENKTVLAACTAPALNSALKLENRPAIGESETNHQATHPLSDQRHRGFCEGQGGRGRKSVRGGHGFSRGQKKCRPTILEMLLAPDIRHERNVMLQCIRFIVRNEFFGLACKKNLVMSETKTINKTYLSAHNEVSGSNRTQGSIADYKHPLVENSCMASPSESLIKSL